VIGPGLVVVRAGLHTTVQDGGRWGHQHLGVPVGGALDMAALRRANTLVGNAAEEAGFEVTLVGGEIRAEVPTHVAVTGATFDLTVAGRPVSCDTAVPLAPGDHLAFGERRRGARAYVSVRGGLEVVPVLGSRSAWPLLARRDAVRDGMHFGIGSRIAGPVQIGVSSGPLLSNVLRVLPGPDLTVAPDALYSLCAGTYRVSAAASRMAYPLEGPSVRLLMPDRPSSGTVTGAIQLLPSGVPVLLLADRQTTGGYPVAAVVISADLGHAAQLAPGDEVRFAPVSRGEAIRALLGQGAGRREDP
jgi:biotin-dependent carboxylase-like uncharacterized protein